jgi:hypothetical protein
MTFFNTSQTNLLAAQIAALEPPAHALSDVEAEHDPSYELLYNAATAALQSAAAVSSRTVLSALATL